MREDRLLIIITAIVLLAILVFGAIYLANREVREIDVSFSVGESAGFDLNNTSLSFGKVIPGTSVSRNILLENKKDKKVHILISAERNIERFFSFERELTLEKGEKRRVGFTLNVPFNFSVGNYSGKVFVVVRK